jgi:hypothetical protein
VGSPEFTNLILLAITTVVSAIVGWGVVVFRKNILHNLSSTDLALLRQIAGVAVAYAEQKFKDLDGPAKLAAATEAANALIASYGLKVTVEQLRHIIEAAVYTEIAKVPAPEPVLAQEA